MPELPPTLLRHGERWRASYAADPATSPGRLYPEPDDPLRSPFQRDRDRIIYSNAFRRLKHKTQVFIHHEGDHFRTRLTHTLEVAQIARSLARPLGLDEDLTEALALAHDLGHPPFGHAGERALGKALAAYGGFDHNAQSLRVVTELERRYPLFDGLNLSWEALEGIVKHNGPLLDPDGRAVDAERGALLADATRGLPASFDLRLHLQPDLEAQAAALADDIAYDCHDLEDGLRAGLIEIAALAELPLTGPILGSIRADHPGLQLPRLVHELIRRLMSRMIADVLTETVEGIRREAIRTADDVRQADAPLVRFPPELSEQEGQLKAFLLQTLYRHEVVMGPVAEAELVVARLFDAFTADPALMPDGWGEGLHQGDSAGTARRVADYIAGMTDRYAVAEHRRLFDATPDLG